MSVSRALFHGAAAAVFLWTAYVDVHIIDGPSLPIRGNYLSKIVWLTIICLTIATFLPLGLNFLYLQLGYHLYAVYASFRFGAKQLSASTFHFLSNVIVLPAAFTVGLMFWGLYLTHRDLIIPQGFKDPVKLTPVFNHALHTVPAVTMIVDHYLWNHGRTGKARAFAVMSAFAALYIVDIHIIHALSGFWPYGILAMLSPLPRMLFLFSGVLILFACFMIGDALNGHWHPVKGKEKL